ncbi:MAG: DUF1080 domain-containing protein [Acidobacteriia bacterium]|nr:DUF1080 domain-containing protein [Terriglobia bacterium]
MTRQDFLKLSAAAALGGAAVSRAQEASQQVNPDLGFKDTPMEPGGLSWHVHDPDRPHPKQITPAAAPGGAPSDAMVLFDGKDLSKWCHRGRGANRNAVVDAAWKVGDGWFEVTPGNGDLLTREKFGDVQLHVEWTSPVPVTGNSQGRGNSGVLLMTRYEIQVLDMWDNVTYADGGAGGIYGQWPPLVTPARRAGEWNAYDIVFEAPKFDGEKLSKPAYFTVFYNGVVVHNRKESFGPMVYRQAAHYTPHPPEDSLMLQYHNNPVRYRNIWIRRLGGYDQA